MCLLHLSQAFYSMEATEILDPVCKVDLFVLHCVFLPQINKALTEFSRAWNLHFVRTARKWSPHQILLNSMIQEEDISDTVCSDNYRIDPEAPIAKEDADTVVIPKTLSPLSEDDLQDFLSTVDTEMPFDDLGVQHYMDCKQCILNM